MSEKQVDVSPSKHQALHKVDYNESTNIVITMQ